ncbi:MAG: DUF2283 domain-containing protein [bacterium]|nr:DUF2283 domain-containing protein [bacterium]
MKQYYDSEADIKWIKLKEGVEDSIQEISPGIIMEFNENKELIGIEIQNYSRLYKVTLSKPYTKTLASQKETMRQLFTES